MKIKKCTKKTTKAREFARQNKRFEVDHFAQQSTQLPFYIAAVTNEEKLITALNIHRLNEEKPIS